MKNIFTALLVGSAFTFSAMAVHAEGDKPAKKEGKKKKDAGGEKKEGAGEEKKDEAK